MAKSYDEKREAFQRMLEGRLPKAIKSVELLANLARKSDYAWTGSELQSMLDQLDDAVDAVSTAFGVEPEPAKEIEVQQPTPLPEMRHMPHDGPVDDRDKAALKRAFMTIKGGDTQRGLSKMAGVFLGWSHLSNEEEEIEE